MTNIFYGPALLLNLLLPLLLLGVAGLQFKIIRSRRTSLILIVFALIWGFLYLLNPFLVMWLPNSLYDPNIYTVCRGGLVLIYLSLAVASIIYKSYAVQLASIGLLGLTVVDLLWSHLDGRYAGP